MTNNEWCDVLCHHGIFGQRWGKRNGPPYPLKPSKHSAREKKLGWRKSLNNKSEEIKERNKSGIDYNKHPDSKYFDSRNYGQDDLRRLTSKFNDEKAYNEALSAKLRSENMLDQDKYRNMSRKQKKELYQKINEMETEAAYNRAYQQQLQAQIDLIRSERTLKELTAPPPTKMDRAKKAVNNYIKDVGGRTIKNVSSDVATYFVGKAINNATGAQVVNLQKYQNSGSSNKKKKKKNRNNNP